MRRIRERLSFIMRAFLCLGALMLLASCGPSAGNASTGAAAGSSNQAPQRSALSGNSAAPASTPRPASSAGQQYLIKSLQVNMQVSDPRKVAGDLQSWIISTDPKATSAGMNVEQSGDNDAQYTVAMTFSVQAALYPQIQRYLADYAGQHGGKLLLLHESVQDVTNDYVDTQSRLANLRTEQQRLQALMGKASSLADALTIEQRLTDVEGQIESIEAHLNALTGQVTFYSIMLNLTPTTGASSPATPSPSGWNPGQTLHDALLTALAFAEWLATIGIWVVVFSVFVVPAGLIVRLVMRWRARRLAPAT